MYFLSPDTQRILVEQRQQELRAAFGRDRRSDRKPVRLAVRRRGRRVPRRAATT